MILNRLRASLMSGYYEGRDHAPAKAVTIADKLRHVSHRFDRIADAIERAADRG